MGDKNPKKKMKTAKPAPRPAAESAPVTDKKDKAAGKKAPKK